MAGKKKRSNANKETQAISLSSIRAGERKTGSPASGTAKKKNSSSAAGTAKKKNSASAAGKKKKGSGKADPGRKNREPDRTLTRRQQEREDKRQQKETRERETAEQLMEEYDYHRVTDIIAAVILIIIGAVLILLLQTGIVSSLGEPVSKVMKGIFGFGAYFLPYILIIFAVIILGELTAPVRLRTLIMIFVIYLGTDVINAARYAGDISQSSNDLKQIYNDGVLMMNGGVFGTYATSFIGGKMDMIAIYIAAAAIIAICLMFILNTPLTRMLEKHRLRKLEDEYNEDYSDADMYRESDDDDTGAVYREYKKEKDNGNDAVRRLEEAQMKIDSGYMSTPSEKRAISSDEAFSDGDASTGHSAGAGMKAAEVSGRKVSTSADDAKYRIPVSGRDRLPDNQKKILDMVKNDGLFETKNSRPGFGLDEDEPFKAKKTGAAAAGLAAAAAGAAAAGAAAAGAVKDKKDIDDEITDMPKRGGRYKLPPLDLLNAPSGTAGKKGLGSDLNEKAQLLEQTLKSFGVDARVMDVIEGPAVTRYEIQPAIGVKVNSIVRLSDDIALNMKAKSIRIEAPIPGKAAVGIEIENEHREMVTLREIIGSSEFRNHKSKLAFTVGRDIGGRPIIADLRKMPHLLIAGATGSGKSVCINTIIASILYKARPEEVKLVLIDPKMVEMGSYNGIPHLLIPVVTDSSKAAASLNWAVAEMTDRYKKFAAEGVRDIGSYNSSKKAARQKDEMLPQIVVIIDELSDLMMVASSQVEDAICRLAQLARAAGIHLIVATQRPSVDVITGLIKANIPSRIAFMVSSQIDSRTIIDMTGAEKLVGNGDMLFKPQDLNKPKRIQGPFVSEQEMHRIMEYIKAQVEDPDYNEEVMEQIEKGNSYSGEDETDELFSDAVETVVMAGQASVSMLQRRFRIGYNRAARIIDNMETRGIIGPQDGSRPRQVLMTEAELEKAKEEGF